MTQEAAKPKPIRLPRPLRLCVFLVFDPSDQNNNGVPQQILNGLRAARLQKMSSPWNRRVFARLRGVIQINVAVRRHRCNGAMHCLCTVHLSYIPPGKQRLNETRSRNTSKAAGAILTAAYDFETLRQPVHRPVKVEEKLARILPLAEKQAPRWKQR